MRGCLAWLPEDAQHGGFTNSSRSGIKCAHEQATESNTKDTANKADTFTDTRLTPCFQHKNAPAALHVPQQGHPLTCPHWLHIGPAAAQERGPQ